MNCAIAIPNVSHNAFSSPSNSSCSSNHLFSPNLMVREAISSSNHHCQELPLLKRKRPTKINIPTAALSNMLDIKNSPRDCVEKLSEIEVEGDGYGVYCKRGRSRAHLEDRYSALVNHVSENSKQAIFGIFDGHGGAKAAEFAATRLGKNILDNVGREISTQTNQLIEEKVRDGYLATDAEYVRENASGGSCSTTALIQQGKLVVSNVGDCRAVICRGGIAEALTTDHTPSREDEKLRIESKGGYVDCCRGVWRIQGSLAVSRAIGDQLLKPWVTAEPDTKIVNIQPDCQFVILASDGLWNKVSNQEAVEIILPFCTGESNKLELARACRRLAEFSISRGSSDDTSVMVIQLNRFV